MPIRVISKDADENGQTVDDEDTLDAGTHDLAVLAELGLIEALHLAVVDLEDPLGDEDISRDDEHRRGDGDAGHDAHVQLRADGGGPVVRQTEHPALVGDHAAAKHGAEHNAGKADIAEAAFLIVAAVVGDVVPDTVEDQGEDDLVDDDAGQTEDHEERPDIEHRALLEDGLGERPADEPLAEAVVGEGTGRLRSRRCSGTLRYGRGRW